MILPAVRLGHVITALLNFAEKGADSVNRVFRKNAATARTMTEESHRIRSERPMAEPAMTGARNGFL